MARFVSMRGDQHGRSMSLLLYSDRKLECLPCSARAALRQEGPKPKWTNLCPTTINLLAQVMIMKSADIAIAVLSNLRRIETFE